MQIRKPLLHQRLSVAIMAALVIAPLVWASFQSLGELGYFALGGISWGVGLGIKRALGQQPRMRKIMKAGVAGALFWGAISGIAELGALWGFIATGLLPVELKTGVLCGLGAASFEIVYVIVQGGIEEYRFPDPDKYRRWLEGARQSLWVAYMGAIERIGATAIHVLTRLAIFVAILQSSWWPAAAALAIFILVDGLATYGVSRQWDWFDPAVCRRFYTFILLTGVLGWALILSIFRL